MAAVFLATALLVGATFATPQTEPHNQNLLPPARSPLSRLRLIAKPSTGSIGAGVGKTHYLDGCMQVDETDHAAVVQSAGFPGFCNPNVSCALEISLPGSDDVVMTCTSFSLRYSEDCMEDGFFVNGQIFCGTESPPTTRSASFEIGFRTGSNPSTGFTCTFHPAPSELPQPLIPCGEHTLGYGLYHIASPSYPEQYGNRQDCTYTLLAERSSDVLVLRCATFSLEPDYTCSYDWLAVNGAKFCGTDGPPATSVESHMEISFHSDRSVRDDGYLCEIEVSYGDYGSGSSFSSFSSASYSESSSSEDSSPASSASSGSPVSWESSESNDSGGNGGACSFTCGKANRMTRIVGGEETEVNEYPWQVAVFKQGWSEVFCGGTILNRRHVLSAAHCFAQQSPDGEMIQWPTYSYRVVLGEHDVSNFDGTEVNMDIARILIHPEFRDAELGYDFAILTFQEAIVFPADNSIAPACLPSPGEDYAGAEAVASGWGQVGQGPGEFASDALLEVTVPVLSTAECSRMYDTYYQLTGTMLCAGYEEGGRDTCSGDSGGPLVTLQHGRYVLIGVTSFGYDCALPHSPGVYGRVTAVLPWIYDNAPDLDDCDVSPVA